MRFPENSPLIDVQNAALMVDGRPLLDGITISTNARRIGIVGQNGSGKTTLARLLSGLVGPSKGTVRISGVDVAQDRQAALRTVGILFQNPDH